FIRLESTRRVLDRKRAPAFGTDERAADVGLGGFGDGQASHGKRYLLVLLPIANFKFSIANFQSRGSPTRSAEHRDRHAITGLKIEDLKLGIAARLVGRASVLTCRWAHR